MATTVNLSRKSLEITTKLPCPRDADPNAVPRPNYTPDDIVRVQGILLNFVPAELADAILDMAEYWPYVAASRNDFSTSYSAIEGPDQNAQWCYMVSPKIPSVERNGVRVPTKVRKVKLSVRSYASVWGKPVHTVPAPPSKETKAWFEATILKDGESTTMSEYSDDVRPNDWFAKLTTHPKYLNSLRDDEFEKCGPPVENPFDTKQRWGVTSIPDSPIDTQWHDTVWKYDDKKSNANVAPESEMGSGSGFLDSLSVDDRVVLMARAPAPGFLSAVFNVKVEIYYSLSSSYL